jgi:hypothetical protein
MSTLDKRHVVPASAYLPLIRFLSACTRDQVDWTFAEFEAILGRPLPKSAVTRAWWQSHPRPWATAGWVVKRVDLRQRRVTFARQQTDSP